MSTINNKTKNEEDYVTRLMYEEITKTKPLPRQIETALFNEYKTASPKRKHAIRTQIITSNLRFALKSCMIYKNVPKVSLPDILSEAKIGLLTAFDKYDPESGIKFISFAVWLMRHRFSKYFDGIDLIRIPTHQKTALNKKRKQMDIEEFDSNTSYFHNITQTPASLDMPCGDEDNECQLSDVIEDTYAENPEEMIFKRYAINDISTAISTSLTDDETTVINALFGLDDGEKKSLTDASQLITRSNERVRQIRDKALAKLRNNNSIKELRKSYGYSIVSNKF